MKKSYLTPDIHSVKIQDSFWSPKMKMVRDSMIPYQWEALNDRIEGVEKSYAIQNMRIAAGEAEGEFHGWVFQDSDLYKWIEAASYQLSLEYDAELDAEVDSVIDLMAKAQQPDGYLNTYFTIKAPDKRWTDLSECHELYCAGHMFEAAVAHFEATGKRTLLDIACRFADYIDTVFGPEEDKLHGYPGHQEIELALVKMYQLTGNERYLSLAAYFINQRGQMPLYFQEEWARNGQDFWPGFRNNDEGYQQAHLPVREQKDAVGHSVRACYMYAGMADVAQMTNDESLFKACETLWNSITQKRMYVTGGIGSQGHNECFTVDYDLPNDVAYTETCAAIALVFFAQRMLRITGDAKYADIMERALYNGVLSGVALDGHSFFYVNPLEINPDEDGFRTDHAHVKTRRQGWYGCACCPPNIARLLSSLGKYVYTYDAASVFVNLYVGSTFSHPLVDGLVIKQESSYPWKGRIRFTFEGAMGKNFRLCLRIPEWCEHATLRVNGQTVELTRENGYAVLDRIWMENDEVELHLHMEVRRIYANGQVRENAGKVALQRGPVVYCLEEDDNEGNLQTLVLPRNAFLEVMPYDEDLLNGVVPIRCSGYRELIAKKNSLYSYLAPEAENALLVFVPYYAWGNRTLDREMRVWVREH